MVKRISLGRSLAIAGGVGMAIWQGCALPSGFAIPEISSFGSSTANAVVANPEEPGAFGYNPAAMGFHDSSSISAGMHLIGLSASVRTASGDQDSQGADWLGVPFFQAAWKVDEPWTIGIGLNAPFGLQTKWPFGTFPALSGTATTIPVPGLGDVDIPTGSHPTESKLEILSLVPTLTYRVDESLSVGIGFDYYKVDSAKLNSQLNELTGDGDAWGWNLSVLYRLNDALSFGAVYRSAAEVDIEGRSTPLDPALAAIGVLPPAQAATLDLGLPWRLQLGVRYAINDALAVEFDWTRTGWSEFDRLEVVGVNGDPLFTDTNAWEDANAYRIGVTWDVRQNTQLRLGYAYDETGQNSEHFSARVPDNNRHLFSIGVRHDLPDGWSLEASYLRAQFIDRSVRSGTEYAGLGEDINGTTALNGDYESSADLIGLEVRKTF